MLAKRNAWTWVAAAIAIAAAGLLYFLTAARDIVVGDTAELIAAAVTLGVAHPPGYPLFTILGHLFTLLPLGPISFRVNLLSVTCNALTVGIIYLTALRLTSCRAVSAVASLLLAVTPLFWRWSLVAEVFPLNNLIASLLIYLLVNWHEQPVRKNFLIVAFFIAGLGLTNHQTIVLLAPAFCLVLWQCRRTWWRRPEIVVICLVAFLTGLLPYLYVPWAASRHPVVNWGNIVSFKDLFALITRESYGAAHLVSVPGYTGGSVPDRVVVLLNSFSPLAGLLLPFGLFRAYRKHRWYFWFVLLAFICIGPFFVVITNLNLATAPSGLYVLERFFVVSHVVLAPFTALGLAMIAEMIESGFNAPHRVVLPCIAVAAATALSAMLVANYRAADQSHNHIARSFGEDVFATTQAGTILLASGDAVTIPLTYLHSVEHQREDVILVLLPLLPADWYISQLRERYAGLTIPFGHYDARSNNLRMLVEANKQRPIAIVGPLSGNDDSLKDAYWLRQQGLLNIIEPKSNEVSVGDMAIANERLLKEYKYPSPREIKTNSFETDILFLYALPALRVGSGYEQIGMRQEARAWYHRAVAIDPYLPPQIRDEIARVAR